MCLHLRPSSVGQGTVFTTTRCTQDDSLDDAISLYQQPLSVPLVQLRCRFDTHRLSLSDKFKSDKVTVSAYTVDAVMHAISTSNIHRAWPVACRCLL
jgi:hypothetical protein